MWQVSGHCWYTKHVIGTECDSDAGPQCFGSLLYVHVLSLDVTDDQGKTPLDTAIENNTSAAFYLIYRFPDMCGDNKKEKLLCRECSSGQLDMVEELVEEHKVDPRG